MCTTNTQFLSNGMDQNKRGFVLGLRRKGTKKDENYLRQLYFKASSMGSKSLLSVIFPDSGYSK